MLAAFTKSLTQPLCACIVAIFLGGCGIEKDTSGH